MSRRKKRTYDRFGEGEDLNPMNSVSNLSDVMMILAVGIMVALVLHWNVPISEPEETVQETEPSAVEFSRDELEDAVELPENMQKSGEVYYDPESGSYYIVYDTNE